MIGKVIGIDFGTTGIKLAQVKTTKDAFIVEKQAFLPLDPKIIVEGRIVPEKAATVASKLKALLLEEKFTTKDVVMGLNSVNDVFVNRTVTKAHSPKEYNAAIVNDIAVDKGLLLGAKSEEILINPVVFSEFEDDEGEKKLDVLLCGVNEALVVDQAKILKQAGLTVIGADLAALAALRSVRTAQRDPGHLDLLVDIGQDVLSVLIHESGVPYSITLQGSKAGGHATYMISNSLDDDDMPKMDRVKANVSSLTDYRTRERTAEAVDEYNTLAGAAISNALQSYAANRGSTLLPAGITLIGGGSLIAGLPERLEDMLEMPVRIGEFDPAIGGEPARYYTEEPLSTDYTVAVGLGMGATV